MSINIPFLSGTRNSGSGKSITQFISKVKTGGLARSNRYAVGMTLPQAHPGAPNLKSILLFCDQISLPGANYSTVQNRTFGEFRELPYEKLYDQITLSFYVDANMEVKKLFDDWQNIISNPVTRTYYYYDDYKTDITIEVQDTQDKKRYAVKLYECYPKSVGNVQLDYSSRDVMKLSVGIQYKYWEATPVEELSSGQTVPTSWYSKVANDFTGFQQTLNQTLGTTAGNFITGSAGAWAISKLPGILRF